MRFQAGYFGIVDADDWIDEILAHLDLTSKANANMRALSGGMKRRVLVGQALVHKPPVIVLDEPTAGVDVELQAESVGVHPAAESRGSYGDPHDALSARKPRRCAGGSR